MARPPHPDAQRLKAEIVERVLAGESLTAVYRTAGMPGRHTVEAWARGDPGFAAALADGRRRAAWMKRYAYDEARAEAFLARARAGAAIRSLLGERRMLSRATYSYWCRTQAPFAEAMFAIREQRKASCREKARARRRGFDSALADRLIVALNRAPPGVRLEAVLAADPQLPCRPTLARWRREAPRFDRVLRMMFAARRTMGPRVGAILVEEIVDHIEDGGSFASYCRAGGPSRGTLRRWYRADAGFAHAVDRACERREELLDFKLWLAAERVPPGPVREMNRAVAPITRTITRLRHRPGAVHRRRGKDRGPPSPPSRG